MRHVGDAVSPSSRTFLYLSAWFAQKAFHSNGQREIPQTVRTWHSSFILAHTDVPDLMKSFTQGFPQSIYSIIVVTRSYWGLLALLLGARMLRLVARSYIISGLSGFFTPVSMTCTPSLFGAFHPQNRRENASVSPTQ